jgi:hypothetical protein
VAKKGGWIKGENRSRGHRSGRGHILTVHVRAKALSFAKYHRAHPLQVRFPIDDPRGEDRSDDCIAAREAAHQAFDPRLVNAGSAWMAAVLCTRRSGPSLEIS